MGGAGNPLTCRGPISISVSAAPTCNGSGIQVARSDDAPRINGSERTRPQGNDGRPTLRRALGAPRSYGGTSGAPAAAAVNVGQPSRAFVIAGCVRVLFLLVREYRFVFQIWRFSCLWPRASKWAAFFGRAACRSVYRGCRQCAVCVGRARGRWGRVNRSWGAPLAACKTSAPSGL